MSYDTFNVCVPNSLNGFAFSFAPFKKIISSNLGSLLEWDFVCLIFSLTYAWFMALQVCQDETEKVEGKNAHFTFFDFIFFPTGSHMSYFFPD